MLTSLTVDDAKVLKLFFYRKNISFLCVLQQGAKGGKRNRLNPTLNNKQQQLSWHFQGSIRVGQFLEALNIF